MAFHTPLTDEQRQQVIDLYNSGETKTGIARQMGIAPSSVYNIVKVATKRGLIKAVRTTVPTGFEISRITDQVDADGNLQRQSVQMRPETGGQFNIPEGHQIKGVSALVDADGNVIQQWFKTKEGDNSALLVDAIKSAFDDYTGRALPVPAPKINNPELLTVYNIADHHLGLYAWGKETGESYDLEIGERVLDDSMAHLVAAAPPSETAIVLNLGDFTHGDDSQNRTARSGNALDIDTRYAKVLQIGVALLIRTVERALTKHQRVIVRMLPGNHDPHTALALSVSLAAFFAKNPRVEVDCDPSKFFWHVFGKVFIAATHGDMVKPAQMPGFMAATKAKEWGNTEYRYAYFGHLHHSSKGGGEDHGVVWEVFQTLAAKDAWHAASGYTSGRSMVAITHHRDKGEVSRNRVAVK